MAVRPTRGEADDGAAALVTMLATLLAVAMALAAIMAIGTTLAAAARARTAADATALAVLSGSALAGGDGHPATRLGSEIAEANGATLRHVDDAEWPIGIQVHVDVPLTVVMRGHLTAQARARLDPPE